MTKYRNSSRTCLRAALLGGVAVLAATSGTAIAQQTGETQAAPRVEEIIVTGSRIRRPNLDSPVPVTSLGAEQFSATGNVSVGDILNELPALRSTYSTGNSTRFIGTAGLNILDLRGLGTSRTLVLQDGRRHVPASEGTASVDVNQIPTDLIERVDVVTGGTSAIYGSDAIAGVVNFVMRRDFEGVQVRGQTGITERGDGRSSFASITAGTNLADGRGNIAFSGEMAQQKQILITDRDWSRNRRIFAIAENTADEPGGSDGIPDRLFIRDARLPNLSNGGTVQLSCPTGVITGTDVALRNQRCVQLRTTDPVAGQPVPVTQQFAPRIFRFQPDGTLREADYGLDLRPFSNNADGGDGASLRDYGQLQPQIERYALNVLGHYQVTDGMEAFFEGKLIRNNVIQESSPNFNFGDLVITLDNPFLSQQARDLLTPLLTPGQQAFGFALNRNNLDLGVRSEDIRRDTWRAVGGIRGDFANDWSYELSLNYGQFKKRNNSGGNRVEQRFFFATDAVRDPATGNIVCRVTIDPDARVAFDPALEPYLAQDVANCRPLNLFGVGAPSQEALNYVMTTSRSEGEQTQFVAGGFISGDSSQFFSLPAGPIGFAVGAEYRRETAYEAYDELVRAGGTFLNAIPIFDPPAFEVKELYGELNVPILADLPFARELSAQGAARVADYAGATGTVLAWNAGATYSPVQDVRFRGNYAVAVRAPDLSDLYSAATQNFASINDPCDVNFVSSGTANRGPNCAAAGIPTGFVNTSARQQTQEILSGGNPGLTEEKSKSWTIGAVFTPSFLDGFSLSVDWYNIDVDNVIASVTAQQIVNLCYDSESLNNAFCQLIQRFPAGSTDARTGESNAFFFVPQGILQSSLNFARRTARGIDTEASYTADLGDFGSLSLRGIATYVLVRNNYPNVQDPKFIDQVLLELGDPRWAGSLDANLRTGAFNFGYQMRYIGKQALGAIENIRSVQGRPPQNADFADRDFYPATTYHDIRIGYDASETLNVYFGVDNLFDKDPPLDLTGIGAGSGAYDNRGRFFYLGFRAAL